MYREQGLSRFPPIRPAMPSTRQPPRTARSPRSTVNIHLSGCTKSCAQHHRSDIALLGITVQQGDATVEGYRVHVGAGEQSFGRVLSEAVPAADLPALMTSLLQVYRDNRHTVDESFGDFAKRYSIPSLQRLLKRSPGDGTASDD
jgi:ferredoxin-nitrite reductase